MHARPALALAAVLGLGLGLGLQAQAAPAAAAAPLDAPNIITIVLDDARADDLQFLPRTQQLLGEQGASLPHYFSSHSLCCPQRATYLRGQYTHNHGVRAIFGPDGGWKAFRPLERSTLATWLDAAGYRTGLFGKYFNGYTPQTRHVPPGWDAWHATGNNDHEDFVASDDGVPVRWRGYQADYVADRAVAFVRDSAPSSAPFFASLNTEDPHAPYRPADRFASAPVRVPPRPVAYDEQDLSDKPAWVQAQPPLEPGYWERTQRERARMLLAVDEMVVRVVEAVAEAGELDRTLFVLTSDNGYSLGEHGRIGKRTAYEESLRLPLLVRGPGIPAGSLPDQLASGVDLAPTLADYAGARTPAYVDGRSLRPVLEGRATDWRRYVFAENWFEEADHSAPTSSAVRTADRKLVLYPAEGEAEAYDLRVDPYELRSRPGAGWVPELRARLEEFRTCRAASCRAVEDDR